MQSASPTKKIHSVCASNEIHKNLLFIFKPFKVLTELLNINLIFLKLYASFL